MYSSQFLFAPVYDPTRHALLGWLNTNFTLTALDLRTGSFASFGEPIAPAGSVGIRPEQVLGGDHLADDYPTGETDVSMWHAGFDGSSMFATVLFNALAPPCSTKADDDYFDDAYGSCSRACVHATLPREGRHEGCPTTRH